MLDSAALDQIRSDHAELVARRPPRDSSLAAEALIVIPALLECVDQYRAALTEARDEIEVWLEQTAKYFDGDGLADLLARIDALLDGTDERTAT